jgi:hypothetical protein
VHTTKKAARPFLCFCLLPFASAAKWHCSAIALALNRASTVSDFQRGMPDTIVAGGNSLRSTIRSHGSGEMHSSAAPPRAKRKRTC